MIIVRATEDLEAKFDGKEIEIGFNARYIMDILDNLRRRMKYQLSFMDNSSPIHTAQEQSNSRSNLCS